MNNRSDKDVWENKLQNPNNKKLFETKPGPASKTPNTIGEKLRKTGSSGYTKEVNDSKKLLSELKKILSIKKSLQIQQEKRKRNDRDLEEQDTSRSRE